MRISRSRTAAQRATRQTRTTEHVRKGILEAAARAFGRKGLNATTMQDIAVEAGYTVPSLYIYFKGKQDIIDALSDELQELVDRTFTDPMPAGLTFSQKLELLIHRQLEFGERWREAFAMVIAASGKNKSLVPTAGQKVRAVVDPYTKNLAAWLAQHSVPADIGNYDPQEFGVILQAILNSMFTRWLWTGKPKRLSDRAPAVVRFLLYGVVGAADVADTAKADRVATLA
jgi:AcrR family transcriptional regulator